MAPTETAAAADREGPQPEHEVQRADEGGDWSNLDLRDAAAFVRTAAREAQEAAWKDTNVDARQIWGVREAQRIYGQRLRHAIQGLLEVRTLAAGLLQPSSALGRVVPAVLARIMDLAGAGRGACLEFVAGWHRGPGPPRRALGSSSSGAGPGLKICARKRPLLGFEVECGQWDAVEAVVKGCSILCHDGRLSRSGRQLLMTHRHFTLDRVWDAGASTEAVYQDAVEPLLRTALGGGGATLLCMGQTGTGKTHTIRGVAACLARDLAAAGVEVSAEFVELHGKKCCDLLAERKEVHLRSDSEGRVRLRGQRTARLPAGDREGLARVVGEAMELRASEKTERNEASSRSHAVCTLRLAGPAGAAGGALRLVDLAGSERNFETTKMTAQQHRESAEINFSLMVLKDCFRAHAAQTRGEAAMLPFRRAQLTRVLQDCFVDPAHATAVIATISPAAADVIHTVNTLNHAAMLAKPLADLSSYCTMDIPLHLKGSGSFKDVPVPKWSPADVHAWLQEAEDGRFAHVVVPPTLTGKVLLATSAQGLAELFDGELRQARRGEEGEAWTVQVDDVGQDLGRAIFQAARRAALAQGNVPGH